MTASTPHLLRITSGRGRPRLDSTAWLACVLQIFRARWPGLLLVGALALAPGWLLGGAVIDDAWSLAIHVVVPWTATLVGEVAIVGLAVLALAGRPSEPLRMVLRGLWRLPVIGVALALRTAAVVGTLTLGGLAADHAGEYGSLVLVTSVILAAALWSAFSLAPAVIFCERVGPIQALIESSAITRNLRFTVFRSRLRLALFAALIGLLVDLVDAPTIRTAAERLLEVSWFAAGSLLTAVSYVILRARARRQRIETAALEIARAIE
ncbi:MAG: hypothetical protein R3B09_16110 [Nannocystaceae bacterium]